VTAVTDRSVGSRAGTVSRFHHLVIRFWHWVGLSRSVAVLLLVGAVAGGAAVAADGPTRPAAATDAADPGPVDAAAAARADEERAAADRAARDTAQRKADEAATAAAEQARKAASATPSKTGKPGVVPPAAPASCNIYSGNRKVGCAMVLAHGWDLQQMACLDKLWTKESSWNERARNKSSGAYGIPQAYPASKLATAGGDWQTNPATQIKWGIGYIDKRYGTPCKAWSTSQSTGSY
jgi:hypothetical protein